MGQEVGWVVNFLTPDGGDHRDVDFPQFEQLHQNITASKEEGRRVLAARPRNTVDGSVGV